MFEISCIFWETLNEKEGIIMWPFSKKKDRAPNNDEDSKRFFMEKVLETRLMAEDFKKKEDLGDCSDAERKTHYERLSFLLEEVARLAPIAEDREKFLESAKDMRAILIDMQNK